ncbi:hypothetical protein [Massilia sp. BJB1822]|nr:hypothetical protein [Massilia sp. BJB1822]
MKARASLLCFIGLLCALCGWAVLAMLRPENVLSIANLLTLC